MTWNINGLRSKWVEAKSLFLDFNIVVVTETKIDATVSTGSIQIPGFAVNRQDRNKFGGGVATFITDSLKPSTLYDLQAKYSDKGIEVTLDSIVLGSRHQTMIVIGVYRPPNSGISWFSVFSDLILEALILGPIFIIGDINADLLDNNACLGKTLQALLDLACVSVRNIQPTRITQSSATCIDIIAIPLDLNCSHYEVGTMAASDHFPVEAAILIDGIDKVKPIRKRSFRNIDINLTQALVSAIDLHPESHNDPDSLLHEWLDAMIGILDMVAPVKSFPAVKKRPAVFFNDDIKEQIFLRNHLARKLKSDPNNMELFRDLHLAKRTVKSRIRCLSRLHGEKLLKANDSKSAWKFIREATFTVKKDSRVNIDAHLLNEAFAETVQTLSSRDLHTPLGCDAQDSFVLAHLTVQQAERMLSLIKPDTATGPDELPAFLLKKLASSIAPQFTLIVNASYDQYCFPEQWKRANIVPVWKGKGSKTEPSNYRPISILPVLARVFEKEVARQLTLFCDTREIIPKEQFGFRSKSGCEVALIHALDGWMGAIDRGHYVGALLIDLSKAFDTVSHQKLLVELCAVGCSSAALKWFTSYLTDRTQKVSQLTSSSDWKRISRGVPQGSGLSPLLFNIYVRNLPSATLSDSMQYADDLTNSCSGSDVLEIGNTLVQSFNHTRSFCESLDLKINVDKTQFIIFKVPGRKIPHDFEIDLDGFLVKPASSVKLLGVTLDRHLTFKEHIDNTANKCRGFLGAIARASPFLSRDLLRLAYIALVRSQLEYCSAIFASASQTQLHKLDVIQKMASRIICGVARNAHSAPLLNKLLLDPLDDRRSSHAISVVRSVMEGSCHPALRDLLRSAEDGLRRNVPCSRIGMGKRRFSVYASALYNNRLEL
jgi:Reverse transcriptase (RNA-dependent DNA polymerase)